MSNRPAAVSRINKPAAHKFFMAKPTETIYGEYGDDWKQWKHIHAPGVDAALERELESIAKNADGTPRYRVRWGCDCKIEIPDAPEYNDAGLIIGTEKGGLFHDDPLCIFDVRVGYKYKNKKGFDVFVKTENVDDIPSDVINEDVQETISIGKPRYRVEEYLDKRYASVFGDGGYFTVWTCEELVPIGETDDVQRVASVYRPFSRYDVDRAKELYSLRQTLTAKQIRAALAGEEQEKEFTRAKQLAEQKERTSGEVEKFFADKLYKEKAKGN